jgi:signal transduction histidine kinase
MDGKAYFRDFSTHSLGDGRRVGIWVYRLAGQAEMGHPEFAAARLDGLYTHVLHLSRPIAAHRPVFNEDGEFIDIACVWANNAFQSYRFEPIQRGELGTDTRVRFAESLLPVVKRAWEEGEATQFFRFENGDDETIYREGYVAANFNSNLEMETYFTRTQDEYIIEWGDDVDMKRRLGSELEEQRATSYRMALETQKELSKRTEHDRFVRELHDNILQELFITGLSINAISADEAAAPLKEQLGTVHEAIAKISKDIRKLIAGSKDREGQPINEQVADVVSYWDETVTEIRVTLDEFLAVGSSHIERIPQDATTNIVNIVKESVSNAVKHSGGTEIKVELSILPQVIMVSITDNGKGIDPRNTRASGTLNMQARAESVGGTVEIRSSTTGVTVEATLPYELEVV